MPVKMLDQTARPSFGLPELLVASLQNRYSPRWFRSHPGNVGEHLIRTGKAAKLAFLVHPHSG